MHYSTANRWLYDVWWNVEKYVHIVWGMFEWCEVYWESGLYSGNVWGNFRKFDVCSYIVKYVGKVWGELGTYEVYWGGVIGNVWLMMGKFEVFWECVRFDEKLRGIQEEGYYSSLKKYKLC